MKGERVLTPLVADPDIQRLEFTVRTIFFAAMALALESLTPKVDMGLGELPSRRGWFFRVGGGSPGETSTVSLLVCEQCIVE
ncbi:MAG TPA: hypothetical protein VMR33_08090 [Candidatus Baltobacteraceae bacterium]|jgi:hypothetical protein|nr:hypothetical protein [Candidatus Baltobacteraceae bacterium]